MSLSVNLDRVSGECRVCISLCCALSTPWPWCCLILLWHGLLSVSVHDLVSHVFCVDLFVDRVDFSQAFLCPGSCLHNDYRLLSSNIVART